MPACVVGSFFESFPIVVVVVVVVVVVGCCCWVLLLGVVVGCCCRVLTLNGRRRLGDAGGVADVRVPDLLDGEGRRRRRQRARQFLPVAKKKINQ